VTGWLWRHRNLLAMLGLTLVGYFLRTFWLDWTSVQGDEALIVLFSLPPPLQLLANVAASEPHPPLMYMIFHYWMQVAGPTGFSVRYVSVIFGVLTIPLIYQLGRRLSLPPLTPRPSPDRRGIEDEGGVIGLAAALLLAVNQFGVHQAQTARNYTLWPALSMASLILLLSALRNDRTRNWAGYAVLALLSLLTHYIDAFSLLFQNLYILFFWLIPGRAPGDEIETQRRGDAETQGSAPSLRLALTASPRLHLLRRWVPIQLGLLAVYLPWLWLARKRLREYEPIGDNPGLTAMVHRLLSYLIAGPATPRDLAGWLVPLIGLLVLWGLFWLYRRDRGAFNFLALYLLVPTAIVFVLGQLRGYFVERYLTGTLPAYLLIIAYGLTGQKAESSGQPNDLRYLLRTASRLLPSVLGLVVLVAAAGQSLQVYLTNPSVSAANDWRGIAQHLLRVGQPGDVIVQNYPDPSLQYYYELLYHGPLPRVVMPPSAPPKPEETDPALRELTQHYRRVWLLPKRSPWWDPKGYVEKWLNREATKLRQETIAGFQVVLYQVNQTSGPSVPLADPWRLGDAVELTGYDLMLNGNGPDNGGPIRVQPGDVVELTLYWRASHKLAADFTVFTHIEDNRGVIIGQRDSQPLDGSLPTSAWQPGDLVRDLYTLQVDPGAPPGSYMLKVGMYELATLQRLVATAPDGHQPMDRAINLAEIELVPGSK
jgi:mannosyltransferase